MARQPASRYITNSSRSTQPNDMQMCLEVAVFGETEQVCIANWFRNSHLPQKQKSP